jgi:hypothetical protein
MGFLAACDVAVARPRRRPSPSPSARPRSTIDCGLPGWEVEEPHERHQAWGVEHPLSKSQVWAAMERVKPAVLACAGTRSWRITGLVSVELTIEPDGSVSSAHMRGQHADTLTGACIETAAKRARFDRFDAPPFTISYPFFLR